MGRRYFAASALAGRLFPEGISARGPWDPKRLVYRNEAEVDYIFSERTGDRKAMSAEELCKVLAESRQRGLPILRVWISEGLEDAAFLEWRCSREQ